MDRIIVPGLPLLVHVGVSDAERGSPQEIVVEVELGLDLGRAGTTDDLGASVDYERVCEAVADVACSKPFRLIEAIAEEVATALLQRFEVEEVRARVRKPGALTRWAVPYAAVEVHRRRDG